MDRSWRRCRESVFQSLHIQDLHFNDDGGAIVKLGFDIQVRILHAPDARGLIGVENIERLNRVGPLIQQSIEETDQHGVTLGRAKNLLEGEVGFGIDEGHGAPPPLGRLVSFSLARGREEGGSDAKPCVLELLVVFLSLLSAKPIRPRGRRRRLRHQ